MRQLVYQVYYTRYQVSFWWIRSVLKYCKVPKYFDQDCRLIWIWRIQWWCSLLLFSLEIPFSGKFSPKSQNCQFKVGCSPSKQKRVICFIESPLKMTKNAFCFILKALFVIKIFKFLSWLFGHLEKTAWLER